MTLAFSTLIMSVCILCLSRWSKRQSFSSIRQLQSESKLWWGTNLLGLCALFTSVRRPCSDQRWSVRPGFARCSVTVRGVAVSMLFQVAFGTHRPGDLRSNWGAGTPALSRYAIFCHMFIISFTFLQNCSGVCQMQCTVIAFYGYVSFISAQSTALWC